MERRVTVSKGTSLAKGAIASMTGFARVDGEEDGLAWTWEIKSVNSKSLDLRCRLAPGLDALEVPLRAIIGESLKRGAITATLSLTRTAGATAFHVNRAALEQAMALVRELRPALDAPAPSIEGLLALKGVLESSEDEADPATRERRDAALLAGCRRAIEALVRMRTGEGQRLARVLAEHLDEIAALVSAAEETAAAQPQAIRARFQNLLAQLLDAVPALPQERLAQEAALLVAKADIREELDRLRAHVSAARELLAEGAAIGRRFDFLCQEFNREANTLCSKSTDIVLTRIGLALKAAIERLREQVQNIE
jgi:uncharacterized protein (TIGR00255 family)